RPCSFDEGDRPGLQWPRPNRCLIDWSQPLTSPLSVITPWEWLAEREAETRHTREGLVDNRLRPASSLLAPGGSTTMLRRRKAEEPRPPYCSVDGGGVKNAITAQQPRTPVSPIGLREPPAYPVCVGHERKRNAFGRQYPEGRTVRNEYTLGALQS